MYVTLRNPVLQMHVTLAPPSATNAERWIFSSRRQQQAQSSQKTINNKTCLIIFIWFRYICQKFRSVVFCNLVLNDLHFTNSTDARECKKEKKKKKRIQNAKNKYTSDSLSCCTVLYVGKPVYIPWALDQHNWEPESIVFDEERGDLFQSTGQHYKLS